MKSNYKILASWSHKKVYTIHCKSWQVLHCIIHVAWSSFTFWCKRYSTQEILLDEDVVWKYEHCSELIQFIVNRSSFLIITLFIILIWYLLITWLHQTACVWSHQSNSVFFALSRFETFLTFIPWNNNIP